MIFTICYRYPGALVILIFILLIAVILHFLVNLQYNCKCGLFYPTNCTSLKTGTREGMHTIVLVFTIVLVLWDV